MKFGRVILNFTVEGYQIGPLCILEIELGQQMTASSSPQPQLVDCLVADRLISLSENGIIANPSAQLKLG